MAQLGIAVPPGHAAIAGTEYERCSVKDGKKIYETLQRQKALMAAAGILNFEGDSVAVYNPSDISGKLEGKLSELGIRKDDSSGLMLSYCNVPLFYDSKSPEISIQVFCEDSGGFPYPYPNDYGWSPKDIPFVQVYGLQNLAVFAAKILSLNNPELMQKIKGLAADKRRTYEERDIVEELDMNPLTSPGLRIKE
ncbi:MAG: hypothetical protein NT001_03055 [Candidatus Woesearchaeota archaeon]|nr:hypothetical protein [Candidatus Woesearchaeota archaeon]